MESKWDKGLSTYPRIDKSYSIKVTKRLDKNLLKYKNYKLWQKESTKHDNIGFLSKKPC